MTGACPICKASAQQLPRTGDATAFHCPVHGDFKVADIVLAEAKAKDYTRDEWEAALDKAEDRAEPDAWPLILAMISADRPCHAGSRIQFVRNFDRRGRNISSRRVFRRRSALIPHGELL
jgi:hypothetical protein